MDFHDTNTINITVDQSQSDTSVSFFEMPFPIRVSGENGEFQFIRLELSDNKQSFTGIIPFKITTVEIDPEYQIISKNNKVKNGIDQEVLNTEIALFPNPARNSLNIQNASDAVVEKVSIYNTQIGTFYFVSSNHLLNKSFFILFFKFFKGRIQQLRRVVLIV